jgi:hypothetical protein
MAAGGTSGSVGRRLCFRRVQPKAEPATFGLKKFHPILHRKFHLTGNLEAVRRHRLPQDVRDTLLASTVEALIASRIFVLPREEREEADTALPMTIAWEGGHLPVFFGNPAPSDELSLEREVSASDLIDAAASP